MNRTRYHVRWTGMDDLTHWIPPGFHRRWCDGQAIKGLNAEREGAWAFVTCLRCVLRREGTRESWKLFKERREAHRRY